MCSRLFVIIKFQIYSSSPVIFFFVFDSTLYLIDLALSVLLQHPGEPPRMGQVSTYLWPHHVGVGIGTITMFLRSHLLRLSFLRNPGRE